MQKQHQTKPGEAGISDILKGDAHAKHAANKGQSALDQIDQALARERDMEQPQPVRSRSGCSCW